MLGQEHLMDLLRSPSRMEPLLGADQPFDLAGRPAGHGLGSAAAVFKRLHPALRMAGKPFVPRLARDPELPTKLRHREMTASR